MLNFREIPPAHIASGDQDAFELFARASLAALGFEVVDGPDRGGDDGRDLIVIEKRKGIMGETEIRWLVSCKHKAQSGTSVPAGEEQDIAGRVDRHKCRGFIAFYSTVPSVSLNRAFGQFRDRFEVQVFDPERITSTLLASPKGLMVLERYFPISLAA